VQDDGSLVSYKEHWAARDRGEAKRKRKRKRERDAK